MPAYRWTRLNASAIIGGSEHAYKEMPSWTKLKRVRIPENGVDLDRFPSMKKGAARTYRCGGLRWTARSVQRADLLLRASVHICLPRNRVSDELL